MLQGEYGIDGVACGVPCVIGRNGIEDIIELELNDKEKEQMAHTCSVIKEYCERAEKYSKATENPVSLKLTGFCYFALVVVSLLTYNPYSDFQAFCTHLT